MPYNVTLTVPAAVLAGNLTLQVVTDDGACGAVLEAVSERVDLASANLNQHAWWPVTCSASPVMPGTLLTFRAAGGNTSQTLTVTAVTRGTEIGINHAQGVQLFVYGFSWVIIMYALGVAFGSILDLMKRG